MDEYRDIETINAYNELKASGKFTEQELLAKMQFGSRDCGRTPIPWTTDKNGGFTSGTPWIKTQIDKGYTVEEQERDEKSVLNFYRRLLKLRKSIPALSDGEFELLLNESNISVYTRKSESETIYVVSNFDENESPMPKLVPSDCEVILNNYETVSDSLKPYQSVWFRR